ncbi:MAG TPA: TonB C-terminal domain-containing protein [Nannocystaceae bacterium]|nr:TonB C-terminal domain-containing protein [Nannocystaceae bacterium]
MTRHDDISERDWALGVLTSLAIVGSLGLGLLRLRALVDPQPARVEDRVAISLRTVSPPERVTTTTSAPSFHAPAVVPVEASPIAEPVRVAKPRARAGRARAGDRSRGESSAPSCEGEACGSAPDDARASAAIAQYRSELVRWFSRHYRVAHTGLDPDVLAAHRVHAVVEIGDDGTVLGFEVTPSGVAAFDRSAATALARVRGEPLPTPPADYPGPVQRRITVTFVCRPGACD